MTLRIAVLGLGEAGALIARDLVAAGAVVSAFDPAVRNAPAGVEWRGSESLAAADADIVLSVNAATEAVKALKAGLPGVKPGALWADLNTSAARLKQELAGIAAAAGISFVDVAVMSPVPGKGLKVPMLVSGPGASAYREKMSSLGAVVTLLEGPAGAAATRKLLRSVFFKGMAAAVVEAVSAARAAGCEAWLKDNIGQELAAADRAFVDRLITGSVHHAHRRSHEMAAATDLLGELSVAPRVSAASKAWLDYLDDHPEWLKA